MNHRRFFVGAVLLTLLVTGCSPGLDVVRWTEEVKAHDGSIIVLEARATRARQPIVLFERRGPVTSVEYYHRPSGAYWKSPGAGFMPATFDLVDGVPYMVVPVSSEIVCIWFEFPEKDLLIYRWQDQGWRKAHYGDLPSSLDFNLLNGIFNERDRSKDVSGFVTLEIKRSRDGERGGGIKGFLERRNGGTSCAGHKARYEKLGRKPLEAFKTDDTPPQIEGGHGVADSDLMGK
jgi:hypothetical protein